MSDNMPIFINASTHTVGVVSTSTGRTIHVFVNEPVNRFLVRRVSLTTQKRHLGKLFGKELVIPVWILEILVGDSRISEWVFPGEAAARENKHNLMYGGVLHPEDGHDFIEVP